MNKKQVYILQTRKQIQKNGKTLIWKCKMNPNDIFYDLKISFSFREWHVAIVATHFLTVPSNLNVFFVPYEAYAIRTRELETVIVRVSTIW